MAVVLVDVDGDTDLDLVVGAWGSGLRLWGNDDPANPGAGVFTDRGSIASGGSSGSTELAALTSGDLDADADADLVALWFDRADVLRGDGAGAFVLAQTVQLMDQGAGTPGAGRAATALLAPADLDGDGYLDVASAFGLVLVNRGAADPGSLDLAQQGMSANEPSCVAVAELDGDGDLDLVVGSTMSELRTLAGSLAGTQ